jgi:hypothetical protein
MPGTLPSQILHYLTLTTLEIGITSPIYQAREGRLKRVKKNYSIPIAKKL